MDKCIANNINFNSKKICKLIELSDKIKINQSIPELELIINNINDLKILDENLTIQLDGLNADYNTQIDRINNINTDISNYSELLVNKTNEVENSEDDLIILETGSNINNELTRLELDIGLIDVELTNSECYLTDYESRIPSAKINKNVFLEDLKKFI
jgi:hypothetical protein